MEPLKIAYPVRPLHINQHFADNFPCVKDFGKPTQHIIDGGPSTCPAGYEKLYAQWGMEGHNGTDLMAGVQPVYAAASGVVVEMQTVPARGFGLGILTHEPVRMLCGDFHAKLRYWHLASFAVKVGDRVRAGDLIGYSDNTGYSSGNHLHFELQPMKKDSGGHPKLVNPPGHIAGAVSVEPYFTGIFAEDLQWRRDLFVGAKGPDVLRLQKWLNANGFVIAATGPGAPGRETENYGPLTAACVARFQAQKGLSPAVGYFGPLTREVIHTVILGPR